MTASALLAASDATELGAAPGPRGRGPGRTVPAVAFVALVLVGFALRIWNLGGHTSELRRDVHCDGRPPLLRRPVLEFLRHHDSHPPLDYLIRAPFAATGNDVLVRLPSVVFSTAALAVFAWWMRGWGRVGLLATALLAVSGFEVFYGREARMYALMQLVGVVVACGAHRWLVRRTTGSAALVGAALLVGVFTHVSGLLLAAGVFLLAGFARDRAAWRWRIAVAAPVLVWAAVWGAALVEQTRGAPADWTRTPRRRPSPGPWPNPSATRPRWPGSCCSPSPRAPGASRADRRLAAVGLAAFVVPAVLAGAVGTVSHFFIPRTLAFAAWAPLVAIAFLLDAALRRERLVGIAAVAVVAVVALGSTAQALRNEPLGRIDELNAHLRSVVRPGDVVTTPSWERSAVEWPIAVQGDVATSPVPSPLKDGTAFRLAGRATGRVWLVESADDTSTIPGYVRCARPWRNDAVQVHCLRRSD